MTEQPAGYNTGQPPPNPQPDPPQPTFWQQVYRHRLALISLVVALISLGYNTWRNEATEAHRNTRAAAFTILLELGELQQITSYRHYFYSRINDSERPVDEDGDWVRGWGKVLLIEDLSSLMPPEVTQAATQLRADWQQHAARLELGPGDDAGKDAERRIQASIETTRTAVLATLESLD